MERLKEITAALEKNHSIVLGCHCTISYSGRAESYLPEGDRVIIIKADKAVIVHQPTGNNPINYMKPGCSFRLTEEDSRTTLRCQNLALKEYLDISILQVHFLNSHFLEDGRSILIKGTEKDMADMLYHNPGMIEKDFMPVSREEQTKYGFIDVFGHDNNGVLTVVECKRYIGDLGAVTQLRRYVEKIKASKGIDKVRGILACPKITQNALLMLQDWGFSHVAINPPNYLERYDKDQKTLNSY